MSQKKTSTSTVKSNSSISLSQLFSGATGMVVLCVVLVGVFIACAYAAWQKIGSRVLSSQEYYIGPGQIDITPLPPWIRRSDPRVDVFRDLSRQGSLSIMDEDLAERMAAAFSAQPWVAKVRKVTKQYPAMITVDLAYRRPVCMVELSGGLMPIDAEGTLLPKDDFSPVEAAKYPRLVGVDRGPMGLVGTRWGDSRVIGAAEIADIMLPNWEKMGLQFILPLSPSDTSAQRTAPGASVRRDNEYSFALVTRGGMKIIWGRSPYINAPGELAPQQKVKKLEQFFAEHGALDYPQGPKEMDLRQ